MTQLSWDSVGEECQIIWHVFPDGEAAKKLVQIGKPATDELLNALEGETRGVAAHIILMHIWEPKNISYSSDFQERHNIIYLYHEYNGLKWIDIVDKNRKVVTVEYKVKQAALIRNAEEWRRKLDKSRNSVSISLMSALTNKYSSGA